MSKTDNVVRMRHMLDAAHKALELARDCKRADLEKDEKLCLALVRLLEVLGEAAKNVSAQCREENPAIPWKQIAGTRDRLIHGYFDVDLDIIWKIISSDLPLLIPHLEKALKQT